MDGPELWLIAGPNGAGKTTVTRNRPLSELLAGVHFLNPDVRTLELLHERGIDSFAEASKQPAVLRELNIQAAEDSHAELVERLRAGEAVAVETVLSTPKYQAVVEEVLAAGGRCFLIYVALNSPELSAQRVQRRVKEGGHDVPAAKLRERWERSLKLLPWFASRAHRFWVFDNSNSDAEQRAELIAMGNEHKLTLFNAAAIPLLTQSFTAFDGFEITCPPT
jgi:predicted ABC-type ATPase